MRKNYSPSLNKHLGSTKTPNPLIYIVGVAFAVLWLAFGLLLVFKLAPSG